MAENYIKYSARTYDEYRKSILGLAKAYYPDVFMTIDDASVGSFIVDAVSDIGDSLNHHIDRTYQETALESASQRKSLLKIARNNGVRVPGRKAAMVEVELSCVLPLDVSTGGNDLAAADMKYAPIVKKGTLFSTGNATFELVNNVDFSEQYDENGISNRQFAPVRNSNGEIIGMRFKKTAVAIAGQNKIYKKVITESELTPFMTVTLSDSNILGVESIILKQGTNLNEDPTIDEFSVDREKYTYGKSTTDTLRYFEVDNLVDQYRYGYEEEETTDGNYTRYNPVWQEVTDDDDAPICQVVRGLWKRVKQKYTTEFTDNGSLKITFGSGIENVYGEIPTEASKFTQYMMSRMEANDYMGILPKAGYTMYILYRVGGGEMSNIQPNTLNTIVYQKTEMCGSDLDAATANRVRLSLAVNNPFTSYGGKDAPSNEEIRQLIKCNTASQNRCVTLHDYEAKIISLPPKYGTPFRCSVIEENNKVVIYTLGLDHEGHLMPALSETVADNIKSYLSKYRMINDFVEIRPGKVINVAIEVDIFVDKTYEKADVVKNVIDLVYDYMDIRHHLMGEEIFLGDLEKEISKVDGVVNLIELRCRNMVGSDNGYSDTWTTQELVLNDDCCYGDPESDTETTNLINLKASDKILYSEPASMIELKYKEKDIIVTVKER